ncbi:MAG: carboxylesterase family protein [Saprospiraceae bacterium]|nr:carboxylesterase family protein [Lewinella sp.]
MLPKILLFICSILFPVFSVTAQTVSTQYGPVTGQMNGNLYEFLGIPYAAPPVGTLRWKPTIPPESWTGPITAHQFPPKCPQKNFDQGDTTGVVEGEEDCLYLNVWSPDISANLPVMVFIHGGGNQAGSTSEIAGGTEIYYGKNMAERGNVVLVTIQYRLGPLGYLVHPGLEVENSDEVAGNYGVMDQIFALQWVQDNISGFGGDPDNVTIFGESGGGVNVGNLLTTQMAAGLFHKAIIESALPGVEPYDTTKAKGITFVDGFTQTGTDAEKITYMRSLSADSLVSGLEHPIQGGIVQQHWRPTLDHRIFQDFPEAMFQTGNFNKVPLMLGSNSDEMSLSAPQTVYPFMVTALVNTAIPPQYRSQALALYPPGATNEEARQSFVAILTDAQFTNSIRRTARCISKNQTEPVWRYFFTHTHNPNIPTIGELGAYHGIELFYVFNTWENSPLAVGSWYTDADEQVEDFCLRYWTNFARSGDPNGSGLPNWPSYDAATDCYLKINETPDGTQCGLRTTECDFWDEVSAYAGCTSTTAVSKMAVEQNGVYFYPNPTTGKFKIHHDLRWFAMEVAVFTVSGKLIFHAKNPPEIDLTSFPPGTYFVKVEASGNTLFGKIVKSN